MDYCYLHGRERGERHHSCPNHASVRRIENNLGPILQALFAIFDIM
jgi:hypothetical protein